MNILLANKNNNNNKKKQYSHVNEYKENSSAIKTIRHSVPRYLNHLKPEGTHRVRTHAVLLLSVKCALT